MGRQDDSVQHDETPDYNAVIVKENDDNKVLVYVKGFKKRMAG